MKHNYKLISVLQTISQIGHDPKKIVSTFSRIKSAEQTEQRLNQNCKALESRASLYREVLPMCEQIMRARIGFPELLAFHTAVLKKAEKDNLPREAAAYRVIEDIENYDKIGGLKNEISKMVMQQFAIGQMAAPREKAIAALLRLQALGVTDGEILNIYEWLSKMREKPPYQQIANSI